MKYLLNSILLILLTSCGAGRTIVHQPVVVPAHMVTNQVQILRGIDTVTVPEGTQKAFEKELRNKLYGDGLVLDAPGIQLHYRFLQFNEGNRLARYALGGIGNTGEASLTVEVIFLGSDDVELGRIQTEGKISSGLFGGSSDYAVIRAAGEVAHYTRSVILDQE